jgi:hypothetical protein
MKKMLLLLSSLFVLGLGLTACNRPSADPCTPADLGRHCPYDRHLDS